jgi:hypothetical protein
MQENETMIQEETRYQHAGLGSKKMLTAAGLGEGAADILAEALASLHARLAALEAATAERIADAPTPTIIGTPSPDAIRDAALKEAASVARGRVYMQRYRTWCYMADPKGGEPGNRTETDPITAHSDRIADAILALCTKKD